MSNIHKNLGPVVIISLYEKSEVSTSSVYVQY